MSPMIRFFDICFSVIGLISLFPVFMVLFLLGFLDTGSPLFRQTRVGRGQSPFVLNKFRTMGVGTDSVATHMVDGNAVTPLGRFLRKSKLDELPQLWNVLKGDMSLVGPRPCLPEQQELIEARAQEGVFAVRPGITGLAQVRGIDMSTPDLLAQTDAKMLRDFSLLRYFQYIFLTISGKGAGDRVAH